MTTELEKQFFDTFGISTITTKGCYDFYAIEQGINIWEEHCREYLINNKKKCSACPKNKSIQSYPQITDRILLELICIINKHSDFGLFSSKIDELKDEILDHCLVLVGVDCDFTTGFEEEIKQQVQALFKE